MSAPMTAQGRLLILSKLVHASERTWHRLVIPGAVLRLWLAMQKELKAEGNDFRLIVCNSEGTRAWRWGARVTVQRPMLLELGPFYADNGVQEGDTVLLFRDLRTNVLIAEIERGPAAAAAAAAPQPAKPPAAASVDPFLAAAAAAAAARELPGEIWTQHVARAAARQEKQAEKKAAKAAAKAPAAAASEPGARKRSSDDEWGGEDGDWSPTHRGRGRAAAAGPLPLRRKLEEPAGHLSAALAAEGHSDEDCSDMAVYTAEQMRRFDALVELAARLSQPAPPAARA